MKQFLGSVILALVATHAGMSAQTLKLSVEDAVKRTHETSKLLKVSNAKVSQATSKIQESESNLLPSLKLQGGYTRLSYLEPVNLATPFGTFPLNPQLLNSTQLSLTANQVIYAGGRLDGAKEIASLSKQASEIDIENDKISLAYNVRLTYWNLYRIQEMKKSLAETAKQLEARLKDAEVMLKGGVVTSNDVLKLQVQIANVKVQQLDLENQERSLMVTLNNLIGVPLTTILELETKPNVSGSSAENISSLLSKAEKNRPDIRANLVRVKVAEKAVEVSDGGLYPQVSASASALLANPNQRIFPQEDKFNATWQAGINFSWDVWNWNLTKHQSEQAQAQVTQASEGLSALKDNIAVEVSQNLYSLAPAKERISVADLATKQAEENATVVANKYKAGTATSTDVIEAETLLLQSKVNKITAIVDLELANIKLMRSVGE